MTLDNAFLHSGVLNGIAALVLFNIIRLEENSRFRDFAFAIVGANAAYCAGHVWNNIWR